MAIFGDVGLPGADVFLGMNAASRAYGDMLSNVAKDNQLREWDRQEGVRSLLRDIAYDEAYTKRETQAQSNKALRNLGKVRGGLYDGSKDGYLKALDAVSPLANGVTRRLSSDGKTIETVGLDGSLLGTSPNYSGKMAERALLQNYGIDLLKERDVFFDRERSDAFNNLQLALAANKQAAAQDELMMKTLMQGLKGLGGGSGGGSRGGRGGSGGDDANKGMSSSDMARLYPMMDSEAARLTGLPLDMEGKIDWTSVTPEQRAMYNDTRTKLQYALTSGMHANGMPIDVAYYNALQQVAAQQQALAQAQQQQVAPRSPVTAAVETPSIGETIVSAASALGRKIQNTDAWRKFSEFVNSSESPAANPSRYMY